MGKEAVAFSGVSEHGPIPVPLWRPSTARQTTRVFFRWLRGLTRSTWKASNATDQQIGFFQCSRMTYPMCSMVLKYSRSRENYIDVGRCSATRLRTMQPARVA